MTRETRERATEKRGVFRFEGYRYDRVARVLYRDDEPVAVQPRVLELLECLLERAGDLVTKEELLDRVWADVVVTEHSLTEAVRRLRETLNDDPTDPSFVQTVRGRGYRFVAAVSKDASRAGEADSGEVRSGAGQPGSPGGIGEGMALSERPILWGFVLVAASFAAVAIALFASLPEAGEDQVYSLRFEVGAEQLHRSEFGHSLVLSPDGTHLAIVAGEDLDTSLYLRPLDRLEATRLPGTDGARNPFFSPDSRWIGFSTLEALKKVPVTGGTPTTLIEFEDSVSLGGGASWGEDDTIVLATRRGLARIPASGGDPETIIPSVPDQGIRDHRWPQVLPGSDAVLFTGRKTGESGGTVMVASLETGDLRTIHRGGTDARYVSSGHLLYVDGRTLFAAPFDLDRLRLTGEPVPIVEDIVAHDIFGSAQYSVSENGTLIYLAGGAAAFRNTINWARRSGAVSEPVVEPGIYRTPTLSPDGGRLAFNVETPGGSDDIWTFDLEQRTISKLTFGDARHGFPVWSPDGRWLAYSADTPEGGAEIRIKRASGAGEAITVHRSNTSDVPTDWSPDGRTLAVVADFGGQRDLHLLHLPEGFGEGGDLGSVDAVPFVVSESTEELQPRFSPDGRWIAYVSDESGQYEVYVRAYPGPGGKWQVSTTSAWYPVWSADGGELFYLDDSRIMAVPYTVSGETFAAAQPETIVTLPRSAAFSAPAPLLAGFDVAPDDRRFVVLQRNSKQLEEAVRPTIVLNWLGELERRVPTAE